MLGDAEALEILISEIVDNALTFTPLDGGVYLRTAVVERERAPWIALQITDTGPGLPPEEQKHVFDRFFRGHLAESGHVSGTGLGLSIAQEIAQAHNGEITVENRPSEGCTLTVWLPPVD